MPAPFPRTDIANWSGPQIDWWTIPFRPRRLVPIDLRIYREIEPLEPMPGDTAFCGEDIDAEIVRAAYATFARGMSEMGLAASWDDFEDIEHNLRTLAYAMYDHRWPPVN